MTDLAPGERARCCRCHTVLLSCRTDSVAPIVSFSASALILMVVAVTFPFLNIESAGLVSRASVIDAITAFSETSEIMAPLSAIVAALIIVLPATRLIGLVYVLVPILLERPPARHAAFVFRLAMRLRPWAMAEIFILGVAVALIKIAGLASVGVGPAFWAFAGFVVLMAAKDALLCERTIWQILDTRPTS